MPLAQTLVVQSSYRCSGPRTATENNWLVPRSDAGDRGARSHKSAASIDHNSSVSSRPSIPDFRLSSLAAFATLCAECRVASPTNLPQGGTFGYLPWYPAQRSAAHSLPAPSALLIIPGTSPLAITNGIEQAGPSRLESESSILDLGAQTRVVEASGDHCRIGVTLSLTSHNIDG